MIEELKVGPSKRPLKVQQRAKTPKNDMQQNFDLGNGFNQLMSPKNHEPSGPPSSQIETKDES